jgi:hypothetical protein
MATITSAATLTKRYNPYTGLSATERAQSGIARAELVFTAKAQTWANAGAGNERVLTATCSLDTTSSYGYVLTDAFAFFRDDAYIAMSAVAKVQISLGSLFSGEQVYTTMSAKPDRQDNTGSTAIGNIQSWAYNSGFDGQFYMSFALDEPKPTLLIYPFDNVDEASQVAFVFGEEVQNRPDISYDLYFRFLQYDVDQTYNYVLNSPQLTR